MFNIATVNKKNLSYLDVSEVVSRVVSSADDSYFDENSEQVLYEKGKKTEFIKDNSDRNFEENKAIMITSVVKYPLLMKQIIIVMIVW